MSGPVSELATQVGAGAAIVWTSYQSWRSNRQTKNTGNGFAKHTTESLERLLEGQERVEGKIDRHLEDHASSDLRK